MRKFIEWLGTWIPELWSIVMVITLTFGSIGIMLKVINWFVGLLGVL